MNIFQINDCDWWIGPSLDACKEDYAKNCGADCIDEDAHELTDEELDSTIFTDRDEGERQTGIRRTFRKQLAIEISAGGEFPRLFASSEF